MSVNRKIYVLLVIIFSTATIFAVGLYFLRYISIDTVMLFGGLSQSFSGLSLINSSQQTDLKGISKANKGIGIFCVSLGLIIIVSVLIKIILY